MKNVAAWRRALYTLIYIYTHAAFRCASLPSEARKEVLERRNEGDVGERGCFIPPVEDVAAAFAATLQSGAAVEVFVWTGNAKAGGARSESWTTKNKVGGWKGGVEEK